MSGIDEKEIERRFEVISKFQISPEVTGNDLERVRETLTEQMNRQQPRQQKIWRIIMKSPMTKLAAAAVIIVAAFIGIYHFAGPIDGSSVAFASMKDVMRRVSWMHIVVSDDNDRLEAWICFKGGTMATRYKNGKVTFIDGQNHSFFSYNPDSNQITVTKLEENPLEIFGAGPLAFCDSIIKMLKDCGGKVIENNTIWKGINARKLSLEGPIYDHNTAVELLIDRQENVPVHMKQQVWGKDGSLKEARADFDYPETGPRNIYDVGITRTVQVVDKISTTLLKGRLINKDGKPVEGSVTLIYGDIQTDEKGEFSVSSNSERKPEGRHVGFAFTKDKRLSRGFLWEYSGEPNNLEIAVEPLATIVGRVVDKNGTGVGDVKPSIYILLGRGMFGGTSGKEWKTSISENGEFKFEGVPVGLPMGIFVEKPGYQGSVDLPELKAGETAEAADVVLKPLRGYEDGETDWTGVLSGRVTNENNEPMAGLGIHCQPGGKSVESTTNSKGRYTLKGLPRAKKVSGSIYADGYGHTMFGTVIDGNELDIQLFPQGWKLLNKKAPGLFVGKWLNTEPVKLEQYQGKVVLLQLGVYLPDYLNHFERLEKVQKKYGPKGIEVIIVHQKLHAEYGVTERDIIEFIKKYKVGFPFGIDDSMEKVKDLAPDRLIGNGAMYSLYDVKATPALYLIDKKGILRISPTQDNLEKWIRQLLAE